ncbi:hypothetical protein EJB05_03074 [Eragrostis curvula]|uniref:Uncharacterized protein n=1 Tax=Eragrostis curvula TaxID=38414 RepID=A0A5J9WY13_9POAL|nr:hypothetical protein EJB05_03074 [Eragrostis curvula]
MPASPPSSPSSPPRGHHTWFLTSWSLRSYINSTNDPQEPGLQPLLAEQGYHCAADLKDDTLLPEPVSRFYFVVDAVAVLLILRYDNSSSLLQVIKVWGMWGLLIRIMQSHGIVHVLKIIKARCKAASSAEERAGVGMISWPGSLFS